MTILVYSPYASVYKPPARATASLAPDNRKLFSCKLSHLESGLGRIDSMVSTSVDAAVRPQAAVSRTGHRKDLSTPYDGLLAMDIADEDELLILHSRLEKLLFDTSHLRHPLLSPVQTAQESSFPSLMFRPLTVITFIGNSLQYLYMTNRTCRMRKNRLLATCHQEWIRKERDRKSLSLIITMKPSNA